MAAVGSGVKAMMAGFQKWERMTVSLFFVTKITQKYRDPYPHSTITNQVGLSQPIFIIQEGISVFSVGALPFPVEVKFLILSHDKSGFGVLGNDF